MLFGTLQLYEALFCATNGMLIDLVGISSSLRAAENLAVNILFPNLMQRLNRPNISQSLPHLQNCHNAPPQVRLMLGNSVVRSSPSIE